jgi:basic amino acid/polyamine antiporter, APA family
MHEPPTEPQPGHGLKPTLGVIGLTIFGIGNMLGAGIYAMVGKAAVGLGNAVWMAFLASVVAAACTGLTYASLGSRYPRAGGTAYITRLAFGKDFPAYAIGLTVGLSGLVSMAAGSHAFVGYLQALVATIPAWLVILIYVACLGAVNAIGMRQSAWMNTICTLVEASGLLLVIAVSLPSWGQVDYLDATTASNPSGSIGPVLILSGAALTFYAFIGFEDVMNIAEEVKNPRRTIPIGLILAISITMLIYLAVAISAVSVVPSAELAQAPGPLALVVERAAPGVPWWLLPVIAMFAVANTGLLNYIMSSRLVYGMARDGMLPAFLARLHPARRTPQITIAILGCVVLVLALLFPLKTLAAGTSLLLLTSFIVMNIAMIVLKHRRSEAKGAFEVPTAVPALGIVVCAGVIAFADPAAIGLAGGLLAGVLVVAAILTWGVRPVMKNAPASS